MEQGWILTLMGLQGLCHISSCRAAGRSLDIQVQLGWMAVPHQYGFLSFSTVWGEILVLIMKSTKPLGHILICTVVPPY